jgi:hypothetical protein
MPSLRLELREPPLECADLLLAEAKILRIEYANLRAIRFLALDRALGPPDRPPSGRCGSLRRLWTRKLSRFLSHGSDECFIAECPSVAAFVDVLRDPIYRNAVKHRQAAVLDSRLICLEPSKGGTGFGSTC